MLYLVEQDAGTIIPTHFHQVTQFQVAVAGRGKIGERLLEPVTVHYTNAFTGYGPLQASSEGMSYFTVRNAFDPGLRPLPEAREELMHARRTPAGATPLNVVAEPFALSSAITSYAQHSLLAHDSGAAALMHCLPPNNEIQIKALPQDRTLLMISGQARMMDAPLNTMDGLFLAAGESLSLQADQAGVRLLELRFPA
jgi:hypothetical protein